MVDDQFADTGVEISTRTIRSFIASEKSYAMGEKVGREFNITQGVNEAKRQGTLRLN